MKALEIDHDLVQRSGATYCEHCGTDAHTCAGKPYCVPKVMKVIASQDREYREHEHRAADAQRRLEALQDQHEALRRSVTEIEQSRQSAFDLLAEARAQLSSVTARCKVLEVRAARVRAWREAGGVGVPSSGHEHAAANLAALLLVLEKASQVAKDWHAPLTVSVSVDDETLAEIAGDGVIADLTAAVALLHPQPVQGPPNV